MEAQAPPVETPLAVSLDGRAAAHGFGELALAYAATIHKAQGSEYPAVVIPLATQHCAMLARNPLRTRVTWGKRLVALVGQRKALAMAVGNEGGRRRWSRLRDSMAAGAGTRDWLQVQG